ncbi:MAG TPA: hypothetical protein VFD66_05395 [Verrucomicrobiae bacterium]|nr:hypothetical protein [Verrucomicrobiae bacterium]
MNLVRKQSDQFTFRLPKREKELLLMLLDQYPLIPPRHQPLSKTTGSADADANQRLLDEGLAEHRRETRSLISRLVRNERRWKKEATGWQMTLKGPEIESLLQALNDIRVGSWIVLGSPEEHLWDVKLDENSAPHAWAMEIAGWFESALLEALQQKDTE